MQYRASPPSVYPTFRSKKIGFKIAYRAGMHRCRGAYGCAGTTLVSSVVVLHPDKFIKATLLLKEVETCWLGRFLLLCQMHTFVLTILFRIILPLKARCLIFFLNSCRLADRYRNIVFKTINRFQQCRDKPAFFPGHFRTPNIKQQNDACPVT